VRLGKVKTVDTLTCTVVVEFPGTNTAGEASTSLPVPWLQRSTEHRPPAVGDHAILIDPSLGNGAGLAITGWPSALNLSPGVSSSDHTLYSGTDVCKVVSPTFEAGLAPTGYAALAAKTDTELDRVWQVLTNAGIIPAVPSGPDAGEPGLTTLVSLASSASAARQSVAAAHVKID
jgi:hypothetical protein